MLAIHCYTVYGLHCLLEKWYKKSFPSTPVFSAKSQPYFLPPRYRRNLTFPRGTHQRPQGFFMRAALVGVRRCVGAPGLGRIVEVVDDGYNPLFLGIPEL